MQFSARKNDKLRENSITSKLLYIMIHLIIQLNIIFLYLLFFSEHSIANFGKYTSFDFSFLQKAPYKCKTRLKRCYLYRVIGVIDVIDVIEKKNLCLNFWHTFKICQHVSYNGGNIRRERIGTFSLKMLLSNRFQIKHT